MHKILATIAVAFSILPLAAAAAQAAPTQINVRIEGESETLFEGPILAEPHGVRAASDPIKKLRRCDGINPNDPENTVPAPTPTAVGADAMALIGESFDGQWYNQYEDYFITRWGPDAQNPASGAYWGILVNDVYTAVGGCQYQLDAGDEVLWVYDAFKGRPTLAMFPESPHYESGTRPLTVKGVAPGQPVPVEVVSYADDQEDNPPATPSRLGSSPYEGAKVSAVTTSAKGFEKVDTTSGTVTNADGKASVTFSEPGWHRIKATVGSAGSESVIRSNRLDVCVTGSGGAPLEGASSCGELPAADQVRVPATTVGEVEAPQHEEAGGGPLPVVGGSGASPPPSGSSESPVQVSVPRLDRKHIAQGRVGISWKVLSAGVGIRSWTISSQTLGRKGAGYVTRANGTQKTAATIRLPKGASYRLRFAITDALGRTSTVALGKVSVPSTGHQARRR